MTDQKISDKTIKKPLVTEKAVGLSKENKYVFRVWSGANKVEVKKSVEKLYGVKVKEVRVLNAVGKKRQIGRFQGWKPGFKKAIVSLKEGHKIDQLSQ